MPIIEDFDGKYLFKNPWAQTLLPNYLYFKNINYARKRHVLPDGDFLDIDYYPHPNSKQALILVHGFEGSSKSKYIKATALYFHKRGFNIIAINLRGCSGHHNLLASAYHSGKTEDLHSVLQTLRDEFKTLFLMGFSLGANLILKYLADYPNHGVKRAVAVSAPFDLQLCAKKIIASKWIDNHFLKSLKVKIQHKKRLFPEELKKLEISLLSNIVDVDEYYTAPLHGFSSASEYYAYASCQNYLDKIQTHTLIINALDDPLLAHPNFAELKLEHHSYIHLRLTQHGGHVGFLQSDLSIYYHRLAYEFFIN